MAAMNRTRSGGEVVLAAATLALVVQDAFRMRCLRAVHALALPDAYIAAGFVRNLVWDHLHALPSATVLADVDVVFHDPRDATTGREAQLEAILRDAVPEARWEVRNQARMHLRHGRPPYLSSGDAIARFPERQTCVALRLDDDGRPVLYAPHGIAGNWALTVDVNPHAGQPRGVMEERARRKGWLARWPRLRMEAA